MASSTPSDRQPGGDPGDAEMLALRYGRRPGRGNRGVLVAAVLAGLLALAWLVWELSALGDTRVTSENVAVEVVDGTRTDITFSVITDPGTTVACTLRAVSSSFAEVGVREVTLGPVTEQVTTTTVSVSTVEPAVSGEVLGCTVVDG